MPKPASKTCCIDIQTVFQASGDCFDHSLAAEENGRRFLIETPKNSSEIFCRIHVDGCLISDDTIEKCDYVFRRCSNLDLYFVELKGKNIKKAVEQIVATIGYFKNKMKVQPAQLYGFVVASKVKLPKSNAELVNMKKTFAKKHGAQLVFQTNELAFKPPSL